MFKLKYLKYKQKYLQLKKQLGGNPHFCQPDELMASTDEKTCINSTFVTGSCGYPAFYSKEGIRDITSEQKEEYIKIFNLINERKEIKYLDIILGAITKPVSSFDSLEQSLQLCITPTPIFDNYEELINKLNENKQKLYTFNSTFPLNFHMTPNAVEVLDLLLKINKEGKQVRITNKMCGSCHRALYYLVKNQIEYKVNPEQGLNFVLDTEEIQKCFKGIHYTRVGSKYCLRIGDKIKQVWPPN
jgi:hypothetical protein